MQKFQPTWVPDDSKGHNTVVCAEINNNSVKCDTMPTRLPSLSVTSKLFEEQK